MDTWIYWLMLLVIFLSQTHQFNAPIHIHGTATPIQGQLFKGKLFNINPETMEYYNPKEKTEKTYNLELWDSLPGPLEDPPSTDLGFQDRATSCVAKALDNLYYERSANVRGEEVKSWLLKEELKVGLQCVCCNKLVILGAVGCRIKLTWA